jgi:hypothetical protein
LAAALTPVGRLSVVCQRATNLAQLFRKRPALADEAIDVVLKGIQAWDNTVYICHQENAESQSVCL